MQTHDHEHQDQEAAGVIDPVCDMTVDPTRAAATADHDGTTYHFCSLGCRDQFEADPARYTSAPTSHTQGAHP